MNITFKLPQSPPCFNDISDAEKYCTDLCRFVEGLCVNLNRAFLNIDDANITAISPDTVSGLGDYIDNKIEEAMQNG